MVLICSRQKLNDGGEVLFRIVGKTENIRDCPPLVFFIYLFLDRTNFFLSNRLT